MKLSIYKSVFIACLKGFDIAFTNVEATLKQRREKFVSSCFNIVSTSDTLVVSTLRNVENPTSDLASLSKLNQRYFNVDP